MAATKDPQDLVPGDVLEDGFAVTRKGSPADFRNMTVIIGKEHDGSNGYREFSILERVRMQ